MSNTLVSVEKINALDVFTVDGVDPILDAIKKEIDSFEGDVSTRKGRDEIASMAHKIARTKTFLDGLGKDLVSDWKKQAKVVDDSRKKVRETLDQWKDSIRAPLTEWENAEKDRVQLHEDNLKAIVEIKTRYGAATPSKELKFVIDVFKAKNIDESWEEFQSKAIVEKDLSLKYLEDLLVNRQKYEAEQAELERLRKEKEERERKEHEERIAKEAADKAQKIAEEKAKAEALKVEQEKQKLIEAQKIAEQKAKDAEEARAREAEAAKRREIEAKERAEKEKQEALEAERKRAEEERLKKIEEEKRREADLNHRKKINNEALSALVEFSGVSEDQAKAVVTAIASGQIPNIRISY